MSAQLDLLAPRVLQVARMYREQFADDFLDWLPANLHVWDAFEREAFRIIDRGFRHYSSKTIIHVLRHHSALTEAAGDGWKLNNNHSPYLPRLFDLMHPAHVGLWEYRETKKTDREEAPA